MAKFGAEFDAMFREAVNSVRGAVHQAAWGTPEAHMGTGVPLNPTPQIVTEELTGQSAPDGVYGPRLEQAKAQAVAEAEPAREPDLEK